MAKLYTRAEAKRRKMRFQILAGMFDFLAVIAGVAVIIACVVLLSALVNWIIGDAQVSFKSMWEIFKKALIVSE